MLVSGIKIILLTLGLNVGGGEEQLTSLEGFGLYSISQSEIAAIAPPANGVIEDNEKRIVYRVCSSTPPRTCVKITIDKKTGNWSIKIQFGVDFSYTFECDDLGVCVVKDFFGNVVCEGGYWSSHHLELKCDYTIDLLLFEYRLKEKIVFKKEGNQVCVYRDGDTPQCFVDHPLMPYLFPLPPVGETESIDP